MNKTIMMNKTITPYAVMTVGGHDYRLKINTQAAIDAEKKLGYSVSRAWIEIDKVTVQTVIIWAALQAFQSNMSFDDAVTLRDDFFADGNNMDDLAEILKEVYICSGFMKRAPAPTEKEEEKAPEEEQPAN